MIKIKFKPRAQKITKNPVFLVGINPGRPSKTQRKFLTWTGPRGASLVRRATHDLENLYFTNVFNWYVFPKVYDASLLRRGIKEFISDVQKHRPSKIMCFGQQASMVVTSLSLRCPLIAFPHPSYVYRFRRHEQEDYVRRLRKELT